MVGRESWKTLGGGEEPYNTKPEKLSYYYNLLGKKEITNVIASLSHICRKET